jgi:hypothetical protein
MPARHPHLVIFVKAPRPGQVKTRLAATLGEEAACAAYVHMLSTIKAALAQFENVELRYAPDDAAKEIEPFLCKGWKASPQGPGALGDRLLLTFQQCFQTGSGPVVVIGSDCPDVQAADLENAWLALKTHNIVLGPARDGGYWLIGMRNPREGQGQVLPLLLERGPSGRAMGRGEESIPLRPLFHGISWSTDKVMTETLERARTLGLKVHLLRELADIDTEQDWNAFLKKG